MVSDADRTQWTSKRYMALPLAANAPMRQNIGLTRQYRADRMVQRQTIIESWFVAVMAQLPRLGVKLDEQYEPTLDGGKTAKPKYLRLVDIRRLWHRAFEQCPDPYLGLKVGCGLPLQAMNILAVIITHSGSLREALGHIARYHSLVSNSGSFRLRHCNDGEVTLEYEVTDCVIPMHPTQMDSVFAGAVTFLSRCMPELAGHYSVELPGTSTGLADGYASYLCCPVRLGQSRGRIHFSKTVLDTAWFGSDGQLLACACDVADQRLRAMGYADGLLDQVKALITSTGFATTSIRQTADALGMSQRSFQRRLTEANTSYRQLVEAARVEKALELLHSSGLSNYGIAEMVGYSEPSALTHLLKRFLGKTPGQLRDELRRGSGHRIARSAR